jgi:arylsulfatase A
MRLNKRLILCFGLVLLLGGSVHSVDKPNFVVINIDDLGYADIGPFGSERNRTPNLDQMASEGMRLTCHYAAPVCSPSRAALMTGCYPKRVLPIASVLFPAAAVGLHPDEETIADLLKAEGYATGCIGKWHLGDQPEFLPTAQGFDYYYGIPYSNDMGTAAEGSKSNFGDPLPQADRNKKAEKEKASKAVAAPPANAQTSTAQASADDQATGLKGNTQPPLPLVQDHRVIERVGALEQSTITKRYTEEAVRFIQAHRHQNFFLYLPHNAVHFPLYPHENFRGQSKNGLIGDWIEEVDWSVGQVLETLRSAKLDTKTFVIFTSDNGGTNRSINKPLRGNKGSTWEGGMRVPTIAWWPGKIPAATSTDKITSMMDILPTFAKLAGSPLPKRKIDGVDLWPILSGQPNAKEAHPVFYYYRGFRLEAVRAGHMKLHLAVSSAEKGNNKNRSAASPQLYDLATDLGESQDLCAAQPETVEKLKLLAEAMKDDLGLDGVGPQCREMGRVAAPLPLMDQDGKIRREYQ